MVKYKSEMSDIFCFVIQTNFLLVLSFVCCFCRSAVKQIDQVHNPVNMYIYLKDIDTNMHDHHERRHNYL